MKIKAGIKLGVCTALLLSTLAACSNKDASPGAAQSEKGVKITFYTVDQNNAFTELVKAYQQERPEVKIELLNAQAGTDYIQKYEALQASSNPPTAAMLEQQTVLKFKDTLLDLEPEKAKYEKLTLPGTIERNLFEGKFVGVPWTTQGYGLLYNKRVVEEAIGGAFDPASVKTRNDLEALFKKVEAAGKAPVLIHGSDWSLGSHYLSLAYGLQSKKVEDNRNFLEGLKKGSVDLSGNPQFNGLLDTFDLLKKYNLRKNDPIVADFNKDTIDFAKGNAAFYFMGDWAWSVMDPVEGRDKQFGIMPVPISNNPDDYGNQEIPVLEPFLYTIDKTRATPEQQEAAKQFFEWMVTSEQGQNSIISKMGLIMPYKDLKVKGTNAISPSISNYVKEGKVINLGMFKFLPGDHYAKLGASMQKYLINKIDRKGFIKEMESYWKSQAVN
ncbi:ABC transporter substrate-binding protein [Paenibacillus elgii]|uniref:ABC transporter substrate-binding protein n=1 Tax=Paenibacillus elgii TaxID=189691 RepID=UPI00203A60CD|nr:ABC transporter substrate-binding protein [Paenibacillus elgii]MCM3271088.1 ABC transporter substrate-binding protein [Paenibacillus elgii]